MYAPLLGRFISPDSIIPDPADPQSWNRFSYVRNNPLSRVDPTGHADISWDQIRDALEKAVEDASDCFNRRGILGCLGAPPTMLPSAEYVAATTMNAGESVGEGQTGALMAKGKRQNDENKDKSSGAQGGGGGVPDGGGGTNPASKRSKESKAFSRFVSKGELDAINETGLLRGGREGDTFFTTSKYRLAENAQNKLALPSKPEYRVDFAQLKTSHNTKP